jgi:hypothetical protein
VVEAGAAAGVAWDGFIGGLSFGGCGSWCGNGILAGELLILFKSEQRNFLCDQMIWYDFGRIMNKNYFGCTKLDVCYSCSFLH